MRPSRPGRRVLGGGIESDNIPPVATVLLDRLTRLRVCTAPQAHLLTPMLQKTSLRNAYHRLQTLVRNGWLVTDSVAPPRGAVSSHYYRPSHRALQAMGLEKRVSLLQRPAQHVLEYLLFRTEVYARLTGAGWWLGSPTFLPADKHDAALSRFSAFLRARALARYEAAQRRRAPAAEILELRTDFERLPSFLPKQLDFEFAFRVDATKQVSSVMLLVVDDVRRAAASQVAALPRVARHDCSVFIRDNDSVWNVTANTLDFTGFRLRQLRSLVAERLGSHVLATDVELPNVWPHSRRLPPEASASTTQEQS